MTLKTERNRDPLENYTLCILYIIYFFNKKAISKSSDDQLSFRNNLFLSPLQFIIGFMITCFEISINLNIRGHSFIMISCELSNLITFIYAVSTC